MNAKLDNLNKIAENSGLEDVVHDGLHSLVEGVKSQEYSKELKNVLHDGFDSISGKLGDKSELDNIVHDGFDQIATKLGENFQIENNIGKSINDVGIQMKQQLEKDAQHISSTLQKIGDNSELKTIIRNGLETLG